MEIHVRKFDELNTGQLYDLLKLRARVFVVEQNCPYQDIDGVDMEAVHVWVEEKGEIVALARVYRIDGGFVKIGRVVSGEEYRGKGYGRTVMEESIRVAGTFFGGAPILIHAQAYATEFYEKFGFEISSGIFLEDGIEHYQMRLITY